MPPTTSRRVNTATSKRRISYAKNGRSSGSDEILVQEMVQDVILSGVVFTHELNTGAPYYVINSVRDVLSPQKNMNIHGRSAYSVGNVVRNQYVPGIDKAREGLRLDVSVALDEVIRRTAAHVMSSAMSKVDS